MILQRQRPQFFAALAGALTLGAWSLPAGAETVRVKAIRISETAGDTAVVIAASARPTFTTWKLEQPARVVLELSGARLGNVDVPIDAGTYAVGLVSASVTEDESAGPRTRVVLTLRQTADYQVETKGSDITLHVVPRTKPTAIAADGAELRRQAEARVRAEAELATQAQAKELAEARAKAEAQAKAVAENRAKSEAEAKTKAQALAETEAKAKAEAQALAETQAKLAAKAQAEAEQRSRGEAAAKMEAQRLRQALDQAQRDVAQAKAEASAANNENRRHKAELAQAEVHVQLAQAEAENARQRAQAAENQAAAARRQEAERDDAVRNASAEVRERQKTLDQIATEQQEQRARLAKAERLVKEGEARLRSSESTLAEREREAKGARERREKLAQDASAKSRADAASAVATAERERATALAAAETARRALAQAESGRRDEEVRRSQQAALRQAEEARLERAIGQRKAEEARLDVARTERTRLDDERSKLEAERTRLESARNALLVEVTTLKATAAAPQPVAATATNASRTATKTTTATTPAPAIAAATTVTAPAVPVSDRRTSAPAKSAAPAPASVAKAPASTPAPSMAASSVRSAAAADATPASRTRSVTLRALSRVRGIDFVDEPSRASVIIDVDDRTTFTVERLAGRRLSLRLEHSELPDNLARNLDATEYLGPVKIISSYRDPSARATVRVDVDLAEDVPNRIRVDGNRIFWDFQKAKTPSLPAMWAPPPTTLFVPARKVAGYVATLANGVVTSQAIPPYLAPPVQSTPDTSSLPAGAPSVAPNTSGMAGSDARAGGNAGAAGGRFAAIGKKRYTGRRIDLDFKGADIHNILRLLADVGQVNVIVADDVRGDVTIKMRDVPWDQALDVVLRSKGLGSVREGNLLRVAPLALLEKELEAEIARQKQIADVLPLETRLIGVSYADAAQLLDKIRDLLSPRGKVSQDHRTNTLIVSDVAKNLQLIEDLVRNLDTQTSQVVIEARIVEANSNFSRQIGVQWGGTAFADSAHGNPTGLVFPYNIGIGGGADDTGSTSGLVPGPRTGTGTTGNPNFLVNMPAPAGLGTGSAIGLTLGSVAGAFNLNLRLSAMETTGQVRILSSPRITTMDNIEAHIEQGVSIPVSVVSAMGAQTQFVDAKLHLGVKPHVTNEGTISMTIMVTRNEPDFVNTGARGDPSIQKKEAKTTMLVRDGDTAVIGGIYTRNTGLSNARVPFFSDIPVLGWFFRNRKENDNRTEFLVFITPRIANRSRMAGQ